MGQASIPRRLIIGNLFFIMLLLIFHCNRQTRDDVFSTSHFKEIVPVRENARLIEQWLRWKKENFLPEMMREMKVDMWIVSEDDRALYPFLVPANEEGLVTREPYFLVFCNNENGNQFEEIHVGNMNNFDEWGPLYPDQAFTLEESVKKLFNIIKERNPQKIAMGRGRNRDLERALGKYASRLVSGNELRNRWIEYRTPQQIEAYKIIVDITHDILAEAFSNKVITPDVTRTTDVDWWVKQKTADLGLEDVFGPTVMVWRSLEENKKYGDPETDFRIDIPPYCGNNNIIRRGDVLSCDFGIRYLGIATDIQQVGYVLKEGEADVPDGLKEAMRRCNRLQDILADAFKDGRTGNEILFTALKKAKSENLRPEIYCHHMRAYVYRYGMKGGILSKNTVSFGPSIGSEGHFDEAGNQLPTRRGDNVLNPNTAYAMELDITYSLPEWGGQDIRIVLEEKVVFTKDGLIFPGGRQTEYHIIK